MEEKLKKVTYSPEHRKMMDKMAQEFVDNLNKNVMADNYVPIDVSPQPISEPTKPKKSFLEWLKKLLYI